jgi:hypothetical protein
MMPQLYVFNIQEYNNYTDQLLLIKFTENSKIILHNATFYLNHWVAKKHVFGSSVGRRGGGCQTLACALGVPSYDLKFPIYAVICRVCVKIV